jgi:hypothetical protein
VRAGDEARSELRAWYLRGLRPKLARAVREGAVDPQAAAAFHAELRELLELRREHEAA